MIFELPVNSHAQGALLGMTRTQAPPTATHPCALRSCQRSFFAASSRARPARSPPSPLAQQGVVGAPLADPPASLVHQRLVQHSRRLRVRAARLPFVRQGPHRAQSTAIGYRAHMDGRGVNLVPDSDNWRFHLELHQYGFEGSLLEIETAATVHVEQNRLVYDWAPELTEWWVHDARGLEHGFTVRERPDRPEGNGGGPLLFNLAVSGGLRPRAMSSGRGAQFVDDAGARVLTYDGLVAFDADGAPLVAWLETTDRTLRIAVLEADARYPLTVDPILQTAYLKASNTEQSDFFGHSVAASGDTVVVTALSESSGATGVNGNQADNSVFGAGAAYVFTRSGGGWSQQAYLKASNPDVADSFGVSVAISGDTIIRRRRGPRTAARRESTETRPTTAQPERAPPTSFTARAPFGPSRHT